MPDQNEAAAQEDPAPPLSAVERVKAATRFSVTLPLVGKVTIPHPEQVAYYGGLSLLVALELIEWPIALAIGAAHLLTQSEHSRVAEELGEVLEDALG